MKHPECILCLTGTFGVGGVAAEERDETKESAETSQLRIGEEGVV